MARYAYGPKGNSMARESDYRVTLEKSKEILDMVLRGPESWTIPVTEYHDSRPVRVPYGVADLAEDIGMWCGTVAKDLLRAGLVSEHAARCLDEMGVIADGQEGNPDFDSLEACYTHPLWQRIKELAREVANELGMQVDPPVQ